MVDGVFMVLRSKDIRSFEMDGTVDSTSSSYGGTGSYFEYVAIGIFAIGQFLALKIIFGADIDRFVSLLST